MKTVKKYDTFELRFTAKTDRPFDVDFSACFTDAEGKKKKVSGFYDGEDCFVLRFLPEKHGIYHYRTQSTLHELNEHNGEFLCEGIKGHGPVQPDGLYLKHADGTRHHSVGTTCYAWIHQSEILQRETLEELSNGWFNKLRMCVFPKRYLYNETQPQLYPFEGKPGSFNYDRPNPSFFRHLDRCVEQLAELDIQADIILFHPYDATDWGFSNMSKKQDLYYLRYVIARLGVYSNVWWSAANEYDLFRKGYKAKHGSWKTIVREIAKSDPYRHMLGIHQCLRLYDHSDKHITHCSLQRTGMYVSTETSGDLQKKYGKPVVWDEINYEGNIKPTFGNCTPQELVRHFWEATVRGAYAGHGETYTDSQDVLWWAKGGRMHGESQYRIKFLRKILADYGQPRFECCQNSEQLPVGMEEDLVLAWYFGNTQSAKQDIVLPSRGDYQVEMIDTWNMKRCILEGSFNGVTEVPLGQKPYMAVFAKRIDNTPLPIQFDGNCLLRDLCHYKGGKKLYWFLTKTPILKGNSFVLYDSLNHLQEIAGDALPDELIHEICAYANDGKLLRHGIRILKKRNK